MQIDWAPGVTLKGVRDQVVIAAFHYYSGNKSKTALSLDISVRTLDAYLKEIADEKTRHEEEQKKRERDREEFLLRARGLQPSITTSPEKKDAAPKVVIRAPEPQRPDSEFLSPHDPRDPKHTRISGYENEFIEPAASQA